MDDNKIIYLIPNVINKKKALYKLYKEYVEEIKNYKHLSTISVVEEAIPVDYYKNQTKAAFVAEDNTFWFITDRFVSLLGKSFFSYLLFVIIDYTIHVSIFAGLAGIIAFLACKGNKTLRELIQGIKDRKNYENLGKNYDREFHKAEETYLDKVEKRDKGELPNLEHRIQLLEFKIRSLVEEIYRMENPNEKPFLKDIKKEQILAEVKIMVLEESEREVVLGPSRKREIKID